jgi:hypothetical protein
MIDGNVAERVLGWVLSAQPFFFDRLERLEFALY